MTYLTERRTYRINLTLFSIYGQMPIIPLHIRIVITLFTVVMLSLALFSQIAVFCTRDFSMAIFVEITPLIIVKILCLLALLTGYTHRKTFVLLLNLINLYLERNWSEGEIAAKRKFENLSHVIVNAFAFVIIFGGSAITFPALIPSILDVISPLNETREHILPFAGEFFIDKQKYFYYIFVYQYILVHLVIFVIGSFECMFVGTMYVICQMFAVTGYRMKNILPHNSSIKEQTEKLREQILMYRIRCCMKQYRITKKCIAHLNSCVGLLLPLLLLGTGTTLSISLVEVTNLEAISMKSVLLTLGQLAQFSVASYVGQTVLNTSAMLPIKIYEIEWYDCPVRIQKMMNTIQLVVQKPSAIAAQNFFVLCLEHFGAVIQTAVSYFMVLRQFQ